MTDELRPCPFCGRTDTIKPATLSGGAWMICTYCEAVGPVGLPEAGKSGASEWNTRPLEDALRADLSRLSHMIPVSERLPEPTTPTDVCLPLIAYAGDTYGYFLAYYEKNEADPDPYWWDIEADDSVSGVTHWYPLPPLP